MKPEDTGLALVTSSAGKLERNAMRWNRARFHLIVFACPGAACCRRHGHTVQIVHVCTGHREVMLRRSQSPAQAPNCRSASEAVLPRQPSWSGSALCLLSSHTPQSRRSHRAATDPRPRKLRDRTPHHVAGSVSVRWRTLWKSGGRPCTVQYPIAFAREGGSQRKRFDDERSRTLSAN